MEVCQIQGVRLQCPKNSHGRNTMGPYCPFCQSKCTKCVYFHVEVNEFQSFFQAFVKLNARISLGKLHLV